MSKSLNDVMEFDCPVRVNDDGSVTDGLSMYVPNAEHSTEYDMLIDGVPYKDHLEWKALTGYTGQYGYNGPCMHSSEYIGGGLERDILATPGVYVVTVVTCESTDDDPEPEPAGWTVLRRKA